MGEIIGNSFPVERLNSEALQQAKYQNETEFGQRSRNRVYTVEQTREYPTALEISYGVVSQELPLEAKGKIKPGTRILVVQQSEEPLSRIKAVYALGENLKEKPKKP